MERKMDGPDIVWTNEGKEIVRLHGAEEGNGLTLFVTGSLNERSEIDFKQELMALASMGMDIVVDLTGAKRMTSGSMVAILDAVQMTESTDHGLCLRGPSPEVYKQLERAHITHSVEILEGGSK